jgi:hypothetical protein
MLTFAVNLNSGIPQGGKSLDDPDSSLKGYDLFP